jgi:hypothetical protein
LNLELTVENKQITLEVAQTKSVTLTVGSPSISFDVLTSLPPSADTIIDSDKYIEKNIINAKGDLIVGSEEAEPMRLPIGSPNYFMVVDPTQDRGYKFTNEIDGGTF